MAIQQRANESEEEYKKRKRRVKLVMMGGGSPIQLFANHNFIDGLTSWTTVGTVTESGGIASLDGSLALASISQAVVENGLKYYSRIDVTNLSGTAQVVDNDGTVIYNITSVGIQYFTFTHAIASQNLILRVLTGNTVSANSFSINR